MNIYLFMDIISHITCKTNETYPMPCWIWHIELFRALINVLIN